MQFTKGEHTNLNDMLGITPERTKELETALTPVITTTDSITVADITEKMAPAIQTPEECYYIGYLIGAIVHDASA